MTYQEKKEQMKNGTYHGNSPFYENIPEFQHLRPLKSHTHLAGFRPEERDEANRLQKQDKEFRIRQTNQPGKFFERLRY